MENKQSAMSAIQEKHRTAIENSQETYEGFNGTEEFVNIETAATACTAITLEQMRLAFEAGREGIYGYGKYNTFESYLTTLQSKPQP